MDKLPAASSAHCPPPPPPLVTVGATGQHGGGSGQREATVKCAQPDLEAFRKEKESRNHVKDDNKREPPQLPAGPSATAVGPTGVLGAHLPGALTFSPGIQPPGCRAPTRARGWGALSGFEDLAHAVDDSKRF